jgi:hypothetical protein
MIELTVEQQQELARGNAVEVSDSDTQQPYVVLSKAVYERVCNLLYDDSEWTEGELQAMLAHSAEANGWNEPGMDAYDRYDEERSKMCP